ncbi:MAG: hypothetical protein WBC04_03565, partial [Candidatus Acidiferrales bacterium]
CWRGIGSPRRRCIRQNLSGSLLQTASLSAHTTSHGIDGDPHYLLGSDRMARTFSPIGGWMF